VWRVIAIALVLAACRSGGDAPVLLFTGDGTSAGDVAAIEDILRGERLDYATVGSWGLNRMTEPELRRHRLLIVPGGNFVHIGNGLSGAATAKLRRAVGGGLNYLGICAGALFAGNSPFNGLNLTSGVQFPFYAASARGIRKTAVAIADAAGQTLDQYWEDGPQLTGWGAVVAKYPDGTPAVVEGNVGNGWVVLTGIHPEAPETWRRGMAFRTAVEPDRAYAARLIRAALDRELLPHY
jgi:glutamine amidotransferase-like uncharacterized protein